MRQWFVGSIMGAFVVMDFVVLATGDAVLTVGNWLSISGAVCCAACLGYICGLATPPK